MVLNPADPFAQPDIHRSNESNKAISEPSKPEEIHLIHKLKLHKKILAKSIYVQHILFFNILLQFNFQRYHHPLMSCTKTAGPKLQHHTKHFPMGLHTSLSPVPYKWSGDILRGLRNHAVLLLPLMLEASSD